MKEIRIKYDDGISDEFASQLVWSVINQGKISNEGKSYCYVTRVQGKRNRVQSRCERQDKINNVLCN